MPRFTYRAIDQKGQEQKGSIDAESMEMARDLVRQQGLFVHQMEPLKKETKESWGAFKRNVQQSSLFQVRTVPFKDITSFTRKLATLLSAGLPLLRVLDILKEQTSSRYFSRVIQWIMDDISSGETLSNALRRFPGVFSKLYISMVQAGEAGGVLTVVLERLAEFYEQTRMFRNRVRYALIYPAVIVTVAMLVVLILMLFVIPKFTQLFIDLKVNLPLPTQVLVWVSSFVQDYFWVFFLAGFAVYAFGRGVLNLRIVRFFWDRMCLKIPMWGPLWTKSELVRISRLLGTLLKSGVPILQSIDIVRAAVTNRVFEEALERVQGHIREGEGVAAPMKGERVFPLLMVHMVDIGEEAGALDEMLLKVSDLYEEDVRNIIETITKLVEPMLIALIAVMVGYIVISMFLPLLTMMSALGR